MLAGDFFLLHVDEAGAAHPRLQLRQALQPLQHGDFGILEEILESGGIQHRQ